MDYRTFDGSFQGIVSSQDNISELKVIQPWKAIWLGPGPDNGAGINHRPEFYPEHGIRLSPDHSQAIRTSWATHQGGIVQGPFTCPAGSLITFTAHVYQMTSPDSQGDGLAWAFILLDADLVPYNLAAKVEGDAVKQHYDHWTPVQVRTVSDGTPFWVGVRDSWMWRAKLCLTLIDQATLEVKAPAPELPDGEWYTIDTRGYRIEIRLTPKPAQGE